jgi:rRNA maturation endonuclease Nob1
MLATSNSYAALDDSPQFQTPSKKKSKKKKSNFPPKHGANAPDTPSSASQVEVKHRLDLVDTHSISTVPRLTPAPELQNLSPAQAMQASFGGNIVVSPAKSATSETEVRVESSFQETLERIRRDMQEELSRDLKSAIAIEVQKVETRFSQQDVRMSRLYHGYGVCNIEDFCIQRMKRIMNIPKKEKVIYTELLREFTRKYKASIVSVEDLKTLSRSIAHEEANDLFHIDIDLEDPEEVDDIWKVTKLTLPEQDRGRYERLLAFGRGDSDVRLL